MLLYIAQQSMEDPRFGMVKANKIMFCSDFEHYWRHGYSITGAEYQHQPKGPTARPMLPAVNELQAEGALEIQVVDHHGRSQKRLVPKRNPDLSVFNPEEMEIIDWHIKNLWELNASQVSEYSHQMSPGWRVTVDGQTIPYETAYVVNEQPSQDEVERRFKITAEMIENSRRHLDEGHVAASPVRH